MLEENGYPGAVSALLCGGGEIGAGLVDSPEIDLISFTGSEARGRLVSMEAAGKFKQSLLELGGNNVGSFQLNVVGRQLTPGRDRSPRCEHQARPPIMHIRRSRHSRPTMHDHAPLVPTQIHRR